MSLFVAVLIVECSVATPSKNHKRAAQAANTDEASARIRNIQTNLNRDPSQINIIVDDADEVFLRSLLLEMKALDEPNKFHVKMEMMRLIHETKFQSEVHSVSPDISVPVSPMYPPYPYLWMGIDLLRRSKFCEKFWWIFKHCQSELMEVFWKVSIAVWTLLAPLLT